MKEIGGWEGWCIWSGSGNWLSSVSHSPPQPVPLVSPGGRYVDDHALKLLPLDLWWGWLETWLPGCCEMSSRLDLWEWDQTKFTKFTPYLVLESQKGGILELVPKGGMAGLRSGVGHSWCCASVFSWSDLLLCWEAACCPNLHGPSFNQALNTEHVRCQLLTRKCSQNMIFWCSYLR